MTNPCAKRFASDYAPLWTTSFPTDCKSSTPTPGRVTEHGRLYYSAVDDWPGFNAMLVASWIKVAQMALNDDELDDFYYGCLMRMREGVECPDIEFADLGSYLEAMETMLILFQPDCKENYDSFDMMYQAAYPLLRREQNDDVRERLLGVLRTNMFHTDDPKYYSLVPLGNAFFTFSYAALTGDDPAEDSVAVRSGGQRSLYHEAFSG